MTNEYENYLASEAREIRRYRIVLLVMWLACVIAMCAYIFDLRAMAHTTATGMTFSQWCCNGRDCQEIPKSAVEIDTQTGIVKVTLKPGDHPTVTQPHKYEFKYSEVRWSTDGLYYACLYPTEFTLRCLYLPPPSF